MQATMICSWLVEIYLTNLNALKDVDARKYEQLQNEFYKFLKDQTNPKGRKSEDSSVDKQTAYDLILSHGHVEALSFFANLVSDYEKVLQHFISQQDFLGAMEVLKEPKLKVEMFVKFVPILILHMDKEIISLCLQRPDLEPRQLIPAFIRYQQTKEGTLHQKNNQALLYLQKVIQPESIFSKNFANDPAIHNYLLPMYVKLPDDSLL